MIGKTVAHYRILAKLGEGGMGVVYKAEDLSLGRLVALKFLPPDSMAAGVERTRLVHEARAAAALLHPNICPVYEIAESEGRTFIAMACIEGQSLKDRIAGQPLPFDEALTIVCQIGEALAAAHEKGIVHRDVKPANVMLTSEGRAILMDFGLAKMSGATKLTESGATLGTMAYLSPEQVQGEAADSRADIWALGVLLYEMVYGHLPFAGMYDAALLYEIVHKEPELLAAGREDIPAGLDGVVAKALAKAPAKRYQRVDQFVADLRILQQDRGALPAGKIGATRGLFHLWRVWGPGQKAGAIGAAALALAGLLWAGIAAFSPRGQAIDSIGVLPLANLTGDPGKEFLADGIAEQLTACLGTIGSVRIISSQTMKQFKGSKEPLREVGKQCTAKSLVEASLMLAGDEVQLTVKLYDAAKDKLIWSNNYQREMKDILIVQSEIARAVAKAINARLTDEQSTRLASARQVNPEAYKTAFKGWKYVNQMGFIDTALTYFTQALAIDSTCAQAYAGRAYAYTLMAILGHKTAAEALPLARVQAQRALDIDESCAEAHISMGTVMFQYDYDWSGAERELKRAAEINPSSTDAHEAYSTLLMAVGRYDAAIAEMRTALDLDPLRSSAYLNFAWTLYYCRRYDDAIAQLKRTRELDPSLQMHVRHQLAWNLAQEGKYTEACSECEKLIESDPQSDFYLTNCGRIYGLAGRRQDAEACLHRVEEISKHAYVEPMSIAAIYDGIGDSSGALELLGQSFAERSANLYLVRSYPWSDKLRSDPGFSDLLRRMNFPRG
jgi:TolB-like protein/Tfp pilus assembly protein PilF/predicted Ser/Thr protein kinase